MKKKERILVICVHNASRSQMADEYFRRFGGDLFEVESAGIKPGVLNPVVVELLREDGIDITGKKPQSVHELHAAGARYDYVFAVCDPETRDACPIFPAEKKRIHWPFPDPSKIEGDFQQKLEQVRPIQHDIRRMVQAFVDGYRAGQNSI